MTLVNDKYEIDPGQPLPDYDTPFAAAYAVQMRGNAPTAPLFALVCNDVLPVRSDLVAPLRSLNHNGQIQVRDCGVVPWPDSSRRMAFVYERPFGQRMAPSGDAPFTPLRDDKITAQLVAPLASALQELARMNVFHGSVRAGNVFIGEGAAGKAMLGDFLAAPAGYAQPAVYEPIARGLAPALARGPGSAADDLYALGVTVLVALLGQTPLRELAADAVVQLKMERGSYIALVGERRFGSGLTELLRGLLADDPKQRWTHQDVGMWLEGRRLTPKQAMVARKASRPLRFAGQEFLQARQLAHAMTRDTKLAAALVKNEEVGRWLSHGMNDEDSLRHLEESLVQARRQRSGPEDERLVAAALMVLDPEGPIRYRGVALFPGGLPTCLADLMRTDAPTGLVVEIIQNDMGAQWMAVQQERRPETLSALQLMDRAKDMMERSQLGYGLERVLYELNPTMPCISPLVRGQYPVTVRQLVEAVDKSARHMGCIDRHVAGFLLARDRKILSPVMRAIESARDNGSRGVAILTLYSDLQIRLNLPRLPGIAGALMPLVEESVRRFRNRQRQEKARKDLRVIAAEGDLDAMLRQIDDPDLLALDEQEYAAAHLLYTETQNEIARMESYAKNRKAIAAQAGEPLAAALAVGLAFVLAVTVIVRTMAQ